MNTEAASAACQFSESASTHRGGPGSSSPGRREHGLRDAPAASAAGVGAAHPRRVLRRERREAEVPGRLGLVAGDARGRRGWSRPRRRDGVGPVVSLPQPGGDRGEGGRDAGHSSGCMRPMTVLKGRSPIRRAAVPITAGTIPGDVLGCCDQRRIPGRSQGPGDPHVVWGEFRGWSREAQALSALARQLTPEAHERGSCAGSCPDDVDRSVSVLPLSRSRLHRHRHTRLRGRLRVSATRGRGPSTRRPAGPATLRAGDRADPGHAGRPHHRRQGLPARGRAARGPGGDLVGQRDRRQALQVRRRPRPREDSATTARAPSPTRCSAAACWTAPRWTPAAS